MAGLRLVEGVEVDRGGARGVARARNGDINVAAALADGEIVGGELDERRGGGRRRVELAEKTVLLFGRTSREVERARIAARAAVAEAECPQLVNLDAVAGFVLERAEEGAGRGVEGVDARAALAEVADEERAAEDAERCGRDDEAPRRVERAAVVDGEQRVFDAVGVEPADEAVADALHVFPCNRVNLRVGDVERAADILDVEGVESVPHRCRDGRVSEAASGGRQRKATVVHVDISVGEVGGVETVAAGVGADGQTRVNTARIADDVLGGGALRPVPRRDVAGDRVEDEEGGRGTASTRWGDLEVGGRVADRAGRPAVGYGNRLRACVEYDGRSAHVSAHELRRARLVVDNPEGATRSRRQPPRVDEQRVEDGREAGDVRDEVSLTISRAGRDHRHVRRQLLLRANRGDDALEGKAHHQRNCQNCNCQKKYLRSVMFAAIVRLHGKPHFFDQINASNDDVITEHGGIEPGGSLTGRTVEGSQAEITR